MSIKVYWACLEEPWMLAEAPESVLNIFYKKYSFAKNEPQSHINYCPVFNKQLKNVFALRSVHDYQFKVNVKANHIYSDVYDQAFFKRMVNVRSLSKKFFSFNNRYIFFTERDSLNVTFYEYPALEDNNITERCMIPSGTFDIGRWFRYSEFAFFLKEQYNEFKIQKGDIYSYIRFHTEEKIEFHQFRYNPKLDSLRDDGFKLVAYGPLGSLERYYKAFKNKKIILKEIRENLI